MRQYSLKLIVTNNSLLYNYVAKLFPNKIVPFDTPTIIVDPTVYSKSLEEKLVANGYKVIFVKENIELYMKDNPNTLLLTSDLMLTLTREKWFLVNHPESLQDNIQILDNYILSLRRRALNGHS